MKATHIIQSASQNQTRIQGRAALLAYEFDGGMIQYQSSNACDFLVPNATPADLMGTNIRELLSSQTLHAIGNGLAAAQASGCRQWISPIAGIREEIEMHVFQSARHVVLEFEPRDALPAPSGQRVLNLMRMIDGFAPQMDIDRLLGRTTELLRLLSGFDRVLACRFDGSGAAHCVAEAKLAHLPSWSDRALPGWTLSPHWRDRMSCVPLYTLADCELAPNPVLSAQPDLPKLDISTGGLIAPDEHLMAHVKDMQARAFLSLSIMVEGKIWGMFSMYNATSLPAALSLQQLCMTLLPLVQNKIAQTASRY